MRPILAVEGIKSVLHVRVCVCLSVSTLTAELLDWNTDKEGMIGGAHVNAQAISLLNVSVYVSINKSVKHIL